jgi:hypothetical protein
MSDVGWGMGCAVKETFVLFLRLFEFGSGSV